MGKLRDKMARDLELRNYSHSTIRNYLACARNFAGHYMQSPENMGHKEVCSFLLHLKQSSGDASHKLPLAALKFLYRHTLEDARADLSVWLEKWGDKYPKLCDWVEGAIEETFSFYNLPLQHHKHMKSSNMLERFNEEIKRRTYVVRIFPNEASCLRLVRALAVETHENWIEGTRYLNMHLLVEHKKERMRKKITVV